jgi:hypothetical protein
MSTRRWSAQVTAHSDALDLQPDIFRRGSARQIALSLKRSAERSRRRKSPPYRSAMSMLTFYINRAGANLSAARLKALNGAKDELRRLYGKPVPGRAGARAKAGSRAHRAGRTGRAAAPKKGHASRTAARKTRSATGASTRRSARAGASPRRARAAP